MMEDLYCERMQCLLHFRFGSLVMPRTVDGWSRVSHPLSQAHHAFIMTIEKTIIDYNCATCLT
jgi:hypothetical protein